MGFSEVMLGHLEARTTHPWPESVRGLASAPGGYAITHICPFWQQGEAVGLRGLSR